MNKKRDKKENRRSRYVDQTAYFTKWVDELGFEKGLLGKVFLRLRGRFHLRRVFILFLYSLALSFTLFYQFDLSQDYVEGKIAKTDFKAQFSFEMVDKMATEEKRAEAGNSVLSVYDYDKDHFKKTSERLDQAFRYLRTEYRKLQKKGVKGASLHEGLQPYKKGFEQKLGTSVPNYLFSWLIDRKVNASLENSLVVLHEDWSRIKLLDHQKGKEVTPQDRLVLRFMRQGQVAEELVVARAEIKDMSKMSWSSKILRGWKGLSSRDRRNVNRLAQLLLTANVTPNHQETEIRRQQIREGVLPVVISVKHGQKLISSGNVVSPLHISLLRKIEELKQEKQDHLISLAASVLFVLMSLVFFSYLRRFTLNRVKVDLKDITVMGLVTFIVVMVTKIFLLITEAAFITNSGLEIPNQLFLYLAPVAAGAMMVGLLISSGEIVWLFTMFLSVVLSFMVEMNFSFLIVTLVGGIAAARGVHGCKKRNDIYKAGVRTGLVNALTIILVLTIDGATTNGHLLNDLTWVVPAGFLGGLFSSLVTMMVIPLLESSFNYTTDVRLLELCNLNHPLLRELLVKAPGTYHHSIVVGAMVEASAEEIGANPLLGKVMGYYHDIGKMEHAQYFIENQRQGHNPHNQISPYMSKTILIAHVKDGAEMGLQQKLGKPIIDGILQHHGTTLIEYFYNRAVQEENEEIDHVKEEEFRYPGPKPQFRESGLLMIADSVEAAARSLAEPTPVRIQNLVKNIIHKKFLDGQLDECNLTLKDLSVIEKSCIHILLSIYHHRIDYPQLGGSKHIGDKGATTIQEALKIKMEGP